MSSIIHYRIVIASEGAKDHLIVIWMILMDQHRNACLFGQDPQQLWQNIDSTVMQVAKIRLQHDRSVLLLGGNDHGARNLQVTDIERGKREAVPKRIVEKQTGLSDVHR